MMNDEQMNGAADVDYDIPDDRMTVEFGAFDIEIPRLWFLPQSL